MSMRKEYEKTNLPDLPNPSLPAVRKKEKEMVDRIHRREEELGREVEVVLADRPQVKLPLRVAYEQEKLDLGKLPIWFLQALGSMSIEEFNQFQKDHAKDMTINEMLASDLLSAALNKNGTALNRFWRLQERILSRPQIVQQVNIGQIKPDAVMSNLLDDIKKRIFDPSEKPSPQ